LPIGFLELNLLCNEVDTSMSGGTFFPNTEAEQVVWLSHYALKLPLHGPTCGIGDAEIQATLKDIAYYDWMLQLVSPATQHDAKEATAYKLRMISGAGLGAASHPQSTVFPDPPPVPEPGMQKRLFSQIARIKASLAFNESIGHDLGVIATTTTTDHPVPEFSLSVEMGATGPRVRLDFKKYGHDGIWIETRTNGGEWAFLAIDTVKPYYDERPLAPGNTHETREYRLRWWDKSEPHGEWSAVQKAVMGS
jgi:hypothetical protein